jgi:hypothetical protein
LPIERAETPEFEDGLVILVWKIGRTERFSGYAINSRIGVGSLTRCVGRPSGV